MLELALVFRNYYPQLVTRTSDVRNAGTEAAVWVELRGKEGASGRIKVRRPSQQLPRCGACLLNELPYGCRS